MNIEFDVNCVPPKFKDQLNTIEKWMEFQGIEKYIIEEDGVVINQNIKLKGVVGKIPFRIKNIDGDVDISYNPINTFCNLPDILRGSFKANGTNIRTLMYMPIVHNDISLDSCKQLMDISNLQENVFCNISFYGCSIKNINMPKTKKIIGDINLSNNGTSSISDDTNVECSGYISLSDNLITNPTFFVDRLNTKDINFSGNPCTAIDEFETECNW